MAIQITKLSFESTDKDCECVTI